MVNKKFGPHQKVLKFGLIKNVHEYIWSMPSGFGQDQISKTFRCGPNIFWYLVDILERTKCLLTTDSIKPLLFVCYWWWRKYTVFEIKKSLEKKKQNSSQHFCLFPFRTVFCVSTPIYVDFVLYNKQCFSNLSDAVSSKGKYFFPNH